MFFIKSKKTHPIDYHPKGERLRITPGSNKVSNAEMESLNKDKNFKKDKGMFEIREVKESKAELEAQAAESEGGKKNDRVSAVADVKLEKDAIDYVKASANAKELFSVLWFDKRKTVSAVALARLEEIYARELDESEKTPPEESDEG